MVDYTSCYQIAFDKILSLINDNEDSWISRKTIEITLQGNLLRHLGKDYSALVSAIETSWTEETTDLGDTILRVIRHTEINKGNGKDTANNVNALAVGTQRERAARGTCTNQECIDQGSTSHYSDKCWVKHPELRAKYALKHIKPRGSKRNLRKASEAENRDASANWDTSANQDGTAPPEINS